ncbi:uncharacterized protein LOC134848288 [Symsagittifera roscoffensis]|uniref:uncharacterized protein LOC134848288 n=1 Tax=Symsagittifera roscoffensis TaxID=84072 RepID=UPI00307C1FDD
MNFGGSASSGSGSSPQNAESIIQQTQMALQMQQVQSLLQAAGEKCIYPKCVSRPGKYLGGGEETCLRNCIDRYLDAYKIVASTYVNRMKSEGGSGGTPSGSLF